jgi:hypothetical protein
MITGMVPMLQRLVASSHWYKQRHRIHRMSTQTLCERLLGTRNRAFCTVLTLVTLVRRLPSSTDPPNSSLN